MRKQLWAGVAVIGAMLSAPALAVPINGDIDMTGGFTTDTGNLATATWLSVSPAYATGGTGIYSVFGGGQDRAVAYTPFQFSPLSGPVTPLWSVTYHGIQYSFDMYSVEVIVQSESQLVLRGSGMLYATGYDPTYGFWDFSGFTRNSRFKFTSSTDSTHVPEPGMVAILGLGLMSLGLARRRRGRSAGTAS
jgi:hypothetical protein